MQLSLEIPDILLVLTVLIQFEALTEGKENQDYFEFAHLYTYSPCEVLVIM